VKKRDEKGQRRERKHDPRKAKKDFLWGSTPHVREKTGLKLWGCREKREIVLETG